MLDMGFQPQVDAIVEQLPTDRITMLFSATLEGRIAKVIGQYTSDPVTVTNSAAPGAGGEIKHVIWQTTGGTKVDTIVEVLEMERDLAVVFVRTKRSVDTLMERLRTFGVRATAIHGGMTQSERLREYDRFQRAECDVLVATDVFARGMDLDRITLVINYDLPEDADTYRHRSGRTGRAGRTGTAVTMMTPAQRKQLRRMIREADVDMKVFDDIRRTKQTRRQPLPESEHFRPTYRGKPQRRDSRDSRHGARTSDRTSARPPARSDHRGGKPPHGRPSAPATYGRMRGNKGETGGTGAGGGSVVSFDPKKGFGFISPERGGADVFFHRDALSGVDPNEIQRGTRVAFSAQSHARGMRAQDVRLLEA
jgi:superfamily II DNA/RNA helicase